MRWTNSVTKRWNSPLPGIRISCLVLIALWCPAAGAGDRHYPDNASSLVGAQSGTSPGILVIAQKPVAGNTSKPGPPPTEAERHKEIDNILRSIKATAEASESRSYQNKMMAREMIRLVRAAVIILVVIAVVFPISIWILARSRRRALPGVSSEVAETLLVVEERQAKLATVLKEIQGEIDYLHSMSVPDLKKLIEQAEKYIEQNEKDLEKAGVMKTSADEDSGKPT